MYQAVIEWNVSVVSWLNRCVYVVTVSSTRRRNFVFWVKCFKSKRSWNGVSLLSGSTVVAMCMVSSVECDDLRNLPGFFAPNATLTKMCRKVSWKAKEPINPPSKQMSERPSFSSRHRATRPTKAVQILKYAINLRLKETFSENSICIISSPSTNGIPIDLGRKFIFWILIRMSGVDSGSGWQLCFVELRWNENYRNLTVPKHFLSLFILNFTAISEWSEFRTRLKLQVAFSSNQVSEQAQWGNSWRREVIQSIFPSLSRCCTSMKSWF